MRGTSLRKMEVNRKINALLPEERSRAHRLYGILDDLEFVTVMPWVFAAYVTIMVLALGLRFFSKSICFTHWGITVALTGALYLLLVVIFKKNALGRRRSRRMAELRGLLASNSANRQTLQTLLRIDPDMARNIKSCLSQL